MGETPTGGANGPDEMGGGGIVIRRLHRMVRHGYRPWLGYDVASGQDRDVELRRNDGVAIIRSDGSVVLRTATSLRISPPDADVDSRTEPTVIAASDNGGFDALFPPNAPNRRNIIRRLYEIGFLAR